MPIAGPTSTNAAAVKNVKTVLMEKTQNSTTGKMDNHHIKSVTFDLDGTIVNSYKTIYESTLKSLRYLKLTDDLPNDEFYRRIGHHFVDIFNEMGIPLKDFDEFIEVYKSFYFDFIDSSELYPGTIEVMQKLISNDIKISLLTTKGQDQADKIIDHFGLRKYFSYVMGRRPGIANKPSAEPLLIICKELNEQPGNALMVGDTELDINCGRNAGVKTCGALYGYRSEEALSAEAPDFTIKKIGELPGKIGLK